MIKWVIFLNQLNELDIDNEENELKIEPPYREIDVPKEVNNDNFYDQLSPMEKKEWRRWLKNSNFMHYIILVMLLIYLIDLLANGGNSSLKEPLFEVLKTVLFTASGYVFAKNQRY